MAGVAGSIPGVLSSGVAGSILGVLSSTAAESPEERRMLVIGSGAGPACVCNSHVHLLARRLQRQLPAQALPVSTGAQAGLS